MLENPTMTNKISSPLLLPHHNIGLKIDIVIL